MPSLPIPVLPAMCAALLVGLNAVHASARDLSDVSLVLGDQTRQLRSLAEASHVLEDAPYEYRWANFQGAAPLFEAQRAGAVDTAYAGDLPVLMAASGGVDLELMATNEGDDGANALIVQQDADIHSVSDLAGKTVVVSSARGSISQHLLYAALEEAGVPIDQVNVKFVLPTDASAAFNAGQIDAWATFDPYLGMAERHGGRVLRDSKGLRHTLSFVTATRSSMENPDKQAAIRDVTQRFIKARSWALAHPEEYAKVYASLTGLSEEDALWIAARSSHGMRPVEPGDIEQLQQISDLFSALDILPHPVDAQTLLPEASERDTVSLTAQPAGAS